MQDLDVEKKLRAARILVVLFVVHLWHRLTHKLHKTCGNPPLMRLKSSTHELINKWML